MPGIEYVGLSRISGPLVVIEGVEGIGYDEQVEIMLPAGKTRRGRVVEVAQNMAIVQIFEGTTGLTLEQTRMRFIGRPMEIPLSKEIIGRVFSGIGISLDGGGAIHSDRRRDINGYPINPVSRVYPRNFIQTGVSAIDCLMTLIRGQKLPIFSGSGMPHNQLAAQIARQARIRSESREDFIVIFAAMGVKHDVADFFRRSFESSGVLQNVVMYLNLADDPPVERIITPRVALTAAEYLAFEENIHVLVILTDMTNYAEALREISSQRGEVPGRKGYPSYLYSDLASLYERAGMVEGRTGSITQIPILTMPSDDITHPVPDLTGFITEGQIVLGRDLVHRGIYPPINILPSLSRLMKDGIGKGFTREDHPDVSSQLFASYAHVKDVLALSSVIGEDELSETDRKYIEFGRAFEQQFISQQAGENRDIEQTLDLAWEMLRKLPVSEMDRLSREEIEKYYKEGEGKDGSE